MAAFWLKGCCHAVTTIPEFFHSHVKIKGLGETGEGDQGRAAWHMARKEWNIIEGVE
jgi:hypothetical protein